MIVVSAGIALRDGRIMLCQRKPGVSNALKWEFPGGKLEKGESPEQALERELREELAVESRTGRIFDAQYRDEGGRELLVLFYFTDLLGEPRVVDCNAVEWAAPGELSSYDLAPTDAQVARKLAGALK